MRALVTNDDGIDAPGLAALVRALVEAGYDTVACAPRVDHSGFGAAIGPLHLTHGFELDVASVAGAPSVTAYRVAGPPAQAVFAARLGALGPPPDVVVSGINPGANIGRAVLHSGTVGAALTAANQGLSAVAVSQVQGEPQHFATAALLAVEGVRWLERAPHAVVLSLNVPNAVPTDVKGVRWAEIAPYGDHRPVATGEAPGWVGLAYEPRSEAVPAGTDVALLRDGWATLTALEPPRSVPVVGAAEALDEALHRARP